MCRLPRVGNLSWAICFIHIYRDWPLSNINAYNVLSPARDKFWI